MDRKGGESEPKGETDILFSDSRFGDSYTNSDFTENNIAKKVLPEEVRSNSEPLNIEVLCKGNEKSIDFDSNILQNEVQNVARIVESKEIFGSRKMCIVDESESSKVESSKSAVTNETVKANQITSDQDISESGVQSHNNSSKTASLLYDQESKEIWAANQNESSSKQSYNCVATNIPWTSEQSASNSGDSLSRRLHDMPGKTDYCVNTKPGCVFVTSGTKEDGELSSTTEDEFTHETKNMQCTSTSTILNSKCETVISTILETTDAYNNQKLVFPRKGNLKRRLSDSDSCSSSSNGLVEPKRKRRLQFDSVTVYYFPRTQGFTCVPSQGGSTLGMSSAHSHMQQFSITEHFAEQRKVHRNLITSLRGHMKDNAGPGSESDSCDEPEETPSDLSDDEFDSYYFLQPVPTRQRRALLRASGINRIECNEKDECKTIRSSREQCGCSCKVFCDPETCSCAQGSIKCQVDRINFPCSCSREGCSNPNGRIEFNPVRVRTHFIHTLMRLEMEKNQESRRLDNSSEDDNLNIQSLPSFRSVGDHLSIQRNEAIESCGEVSTSYTQLWGANYQNDSHYFEQRANVYGQQQLSSRFDYQQEINHFESYVAYQVEQQPYGFYEYRNTLPLSHSYTTDNYPSTSFEQPYQAETAPNATSIISQTYTNYQDGETELAYNPPSYPVTVYEESSFAQSCQTNSDTALNEEHSVEPKDIESGVQEQTQAAYTELNIRSVNDETLLGRGSAKNPKSQSREQTSESDLAAIIKKTMVESVTV
ncbi:uncharacterized protein LOC136032238 [Artemia franciscana]|uniref:Cysteine/serine-rich nuclear protein N-terminal domain-containing protein n=1 Tax=Artemia franciscana TaxID=6661 RepID=A0AA88LD75_ARTSF|nr:hypothetical protein QYM36_000510 [Artemia franciscana]KAK2726068.1 hypothetical protein QYM36_000510 [Artemia franciscana]KAK2726069.1 hypothetical protein QYM36_000510 [Artemia franciscana]KAK2726070.1 hypothetical protein QYM36_000510 [Artemia franciscana]KAK2726071.1 hypothetical protein QYM36_000510 [Artemia franciscana]